MASCRPNQEGEERPQVVTSLFAHYLGSDHVNHLANKMEAHLASLPYHREQKNLDWSQYTDAHIKQHTIAKT